MMMTERRVLVEINETLFYGASVGLPGVCAAGREEGSRRRRKDHMIGEGERTEKREREREGETSRQEMMVYFVGIGGGRSRRIKGICLRETAGERD
jgi:hypothetical protein